MRGTPGSAGGKTPGWGRGHVHLERLQIPGFLAAASGLLLLLARLPGRPGVEGPRKLVPRLSPAVGSGRGGRMTAVGHVTDLDMAGRDTGIAGIAGLRVATPGQVLLRLLGAGSSVRRGVRPCS